MSQTRNYHILIRVVELSNTFVFDNTISYITRVNDITNNKQTVSNKRVYINTTTDKR